MAVKKTKESKPKEPKKNKAAETEQKAMPENPVLSKNPIRALMFKDAMLQEIVDGLKAEQVPKEDMDEVLFLTAANAVLERIGLNLPEDLSYVFKENLDDYLSIALINKEHEVDLLSLFRDQFLESQGDDFNDERELMEALVAFEDQWWGSTKDFLGGASPNELMDQARQKMDSVLEHDDGCGCEECGEEDYWASRSYIIRDLWFSNIEGSMAKESMPSPQKRERLFISVANALLDLVVNVMPDFMSEDMFKGLDHNLELTLVNKENKVDVLEMFEAALAKFEDEWWNSALKELGGKTPDQAMQAMGRKYGL
ncbi:MAG TPA: hypothetical protein PKJ15_01090 [Methanomassiliicoccales archaeon]|nr:MAG: hypothetical protein A4E30_01083 [Methanomassiliicoccales archaeon PtaB.Bin215]HNU35167.1 hypothetical protein [Methanomassiliicoccales archaeon]